MKAVAGNDEKSMAGDCAGPTDEERAVLGVIGLQGHIDAIESGRVYGWAWDPEKPDERVSVDIYFKEDAAGTALADRFRQDLMDVGVGDGSHAFVFDLPADARDADPASIAVYFNATQIPLSRGGHGKLPTRDPEADPVAILTDRMARIETSVQQMFRAMHIIRRGDDDNSRVAGVQEMEALQKSVAEAADRQVSLTQTVEKLGTATSAAQSFIDRFEIEIHDRITRNELDDIRREVVQFRTALRLLFGVLVATIAGLGYALFLLQP
jgi:hypothetical protein